MKHIYKSVFSYLRIAFAGTLLSAALALALSTLLSTPTPPAPQFGERHMGSGKFLKHTEELVAAKIGDMDESPTSLADQNYQLNGGDSITADNIAGAQAAFAAIQKNGVGAGKNSTTSWFQIGPTKATYPAFLNRHGSAPSGLVQPAAVSGGRTRACREPAAGSTFRTASFTPERLAL